MNDLTLGIRLVIVLPTIFFLISQFLTYRLKTLSEKDMSTTSSSAGTTSILSRIGQAASVQFRWEFFIDSAILSMANGLILVFELSRTEYGIILLILGVVGSLAGLVETYCKSDDGVTIISLVLYTLFLSEMVYFTTFGISYNVLGFSFIPRYFFVLVWLAMILFVFLAAIFGQPQPTKTPS